MPDVSDPPRPALVSISNVELIEAGQDWETSTGVFTFTAEDLQSAIALQADPAVRTPVLKLGHTDPRFDGQPSFGRLANLRLSEDGLTLIGDYALEDEDNSVFVGYQADCREFWWGVGTPEGERLGGYCPTLKLLLLDTWGFVEWESAQDVVRMLHADAGWVAEATTEGRGGEVTRILAHALGAPTPV